MEPIVKRKRVIIVAQGVPQQPQRAPAHPYKKSHKKKLRVSMTGLEGKRSREGKRVNEREVDPDKRVERLLAIAQAARGPEWLEHEIEVHERKLQDLREALRRFRSDAR